MDSRITDIVLPDLNDFLKSRHPSSTLQFITGMMIGWTHFGKKQPSRTEIDLAWSNYFTLLRNSIDKRLSLLSSQSISSERKKILDIPHQIYEKQKIEETITLLGDMSPDDAISFIVNVTVNWCFAIPQNYLSLLPDAPQDESDESVANAIYEWLEKYYDLWG
ncbi:MAG: hypothetical protein MHPDNHAH_01085 [Anaerolineales bacterium]|nr:hypothetical protein [Anaerolineales bacterium]WKZ46481.1 MAG: hypothetical protein QY306_11760 [Anaerolineales bacterium]